MDKLLIELQYFGPIEYYIKLAEHEDIVFEKQENFEKSTYRNRCYIAGPNGKLRLSIPIESGKNQRIRYKDTQISYDENWQKIHWQSLCSSYRRSPYFEYYEDHFVPFYEKKYKHLYDYNLELTELMIKLLPLSINLEFTKEYSKESSEGVIDYRSTILPTISQQLTTNNYMPTYHQVFQDRNGFIENLSIVDLLFNEGPQAVNLLKASF